MSETNTESTLADLLAPIADKIRKQCVLQDGHLIYNGEHADVKYIPPVPIQGKRVSPLNILFADYHKLLTLKFGKLRKFCKASMCLEPTHYCLPSDYNSPTDIDGNGWNQKQREDLQWRLGLLPQAYNEIDCVIFPGSKSVEGYGQGITFNHKSIFPHVASLQLKLSRPLQKDMQASHLCDNPPCVNPHHLVEETGPTNCRRKSTAKLSEDDIKKIVLLTKRGIYTHKEIAAQFGVTRGMISHISRGEAHQELTKIEDKKKVKKEDILITPAKMKQIQQRLALTEKIVDPETKETHWIPKVKPNKQGYVTTTIFRVDTRYHILGAILQCNLPRFPDRKKQEFALHKCRRRDCCAPHHLYIGTAKQNGEDRKRDGTHRNQGTISMETANQIREANETHIQVAKKFNVSLGLVNHIRCGCTWIDE
jgi:hypothetical protein